MWIPRRSASWGARDEESQGALANKVIWLRDGLAKRSRARSEKMMKVRRERWSEKE